MLEQETRSASLVEADLPRSLRLVIRAEPTLPLAGLLVFDHLLHFRAHRLRQLAISVQRRILGRVRSLRLVVDVHAAAAGEVTVADNHALKI